jgi:hypothetical protein
LTSSVGAVCGNESSYKQKGPPANQLKLWRATTTMRGPAIILPRPRSKGKCRLLQPAFKTWQEKHPAKTRSCGRPSGRGHQPPMTTTFPLHRKKTGRTTKKLTAAKSPAAGKTRRRKLHPEIGTGQRAQEAPPLPTDRRQLKLHGHPNSRTDQIGRLNSPNYQIDQTNDRINQIIRPDSSIT